MLNHRYKPPASEVDAEAPQPTSGSRWIAITLAVLCIVSGIVRMAGIAVASARGHVSMLTVYVICIDPILWCILGYFIYCRSKYALAAAILAVITPHLLQPWGTLLLERDLGGDTSYFNYWNDVSLRFKSMGAANAVFYVCVLAFSAWEFRARFLSAKQGGGEP